MTKLEQAARQALEVLKNQSPDRDMVRAAFALQEALAEPQITTPDVCGEVCARAKLCYGCNKDLEKANAKYSKQAEQSSYAATPTTLAEPVAWWNGKETAWFEHELDGHPAPDGCTIPLYAAPLAKQDSHATHVVRTKDLTDNEILEADNHSHGNTEWTKKKAFARAVIAADREKNNVK